MFVSQADKRWLPNGEQPYGNANELEFNHLSTQIIGEWQGQSVWLIMQNVVSRTIHKELSSIRPLLTESGQSLFLLVGRTV